ncbi:hypothetical protein LJC68_06165 [Bacteroidales bacterium OttesenSCG-928-B11]|nr:hypothetical protein [Bacteroidales bacterium OttesenSCG-928-B11]
MKNTAERKASKTANANGVKLMKPFEKKIEPNAPQAEPTATETAKMEIPQAETGKVEPPKVEVPAAETLKAPETATVEELQKRLNAEIERLHQKNKLAKKRSALVECHAEMVDYSESIKEEKEFETASGKIVFQMFENDEKYSRANYNDRFTITNTALIVKFIEMLIGEVKIKIEELETQLLQP